MKRLLIVAGIVLIFQMTGCSQHVTKQKADVKGMSHSEDSSVERLLKNAHFNGAVYIEHHNKELLNQAYGYKNVNLVPLKKDDMFLDGSVEKFLTGIIVRKLEDEGKIDRNQQLAYYLPQFTGLNITVKDLLMHRSGLKHIKPMKTTNGLNSTINKIAAQGIDPSIYHQYHYNDVNYIVLAKIIEVTSQQSYEHNLQKYIVQPLGLKSTVLYNKSTMQSHFAEGMINSKKKRALKPYGLDQYIGAGSHYLSVKDLGKIAHAYSHHQLFSKEELNVLLSNVEGNIQTYRYGFHVKKGYLRIRGVFYGQEMVGWFNDKTIVILATNTFDAAHSKKSEQLVEQIFKIVSN